MDGDLSTYEGFITKQIHGIVNGYTVVTNVLQRACVIEVTKNNEKVSELPENNTSDLELV